MNNVVSAGYCVRENRAGGVFLNDTRGIATTGVAVVRDNARGSFWQGAEDLRGKGKLNAGERKTKCAGKENQMRGRGIPPGKKDRFWQEFPLWRVKKYEIGLQTENFDI